MEHPPRRPDVADALSADRPVVALESTIIAHGLPRPRQSRGGPRDRADGTGQRARFRRRSACVGGELVRRAGRRRADPAGHEPTAWPSCRSATWRWRPPPASTARPRWPRPARWPLRAGIARVRHRRAGRGAPGGGADLRRVGRPGHAGAHPDRGGLRRGEVDPRRRRHAGAAGDARGGRGRLPQPRASPASTSPTPASTWTGRWTRPDEVAAVLRARQAQGVHHGAMVVANPLPADEQLDPALHDRMLAEGLAGLERDGVTGKAVTPFLLAHFHERTGGRQPRRERPDHPAQRRPGRPDRRRAAELTAAGVSPACARSSSATSSPTSSRCSVDRSRPGSDTAAAIRLTGGGSGGQHRRLAGRARRGR